MRTIKPLKAVDRGGVSHCIKANYWKVSMSNFKHSDGRVATGVIEYYEHKISEDAEEQ